MELLMTLSIVLSVVYAGIILLYSYYWKQTPLWELPSDKEPGTSVAIIVAARNESKVIADCIESLLAQDFPKDLFEVIVVNDHSADDTAAIVSGYTESNIRLLHLPKKESGKKAAIAYAMTFVNRKLVVTTDADCTMGKDWLKHLVLFYEEKKVRFIAAPVSFHRGLSVFEQFQALDFMGMMGVTAAGITGNFMRTCNGANLAYEYSLFQELNGFEGINHIASGDDILLMQKAAATNTNALAFIKSPEAGTFTLAPSNISDFIRQRVRWGTKSSGYTEWPIKLILGGVWLSSIAIVLSSIVAVTLSSKVWFIATGVQLLIKGVADFYYLRMLARFFKRPELIRYFLPALFLHIWYIAYVGTLSLFKKKYIWKDRKVT